MSMTLKKKKRANSGGANVAAVKVKLSLYPRPNNNDGIPAWDIPPNGSLYIMTSTLSNGPNVVSYSTTRPSTYATQTLPVAVPLPAFWHHQQSQAAAAVVVPSLQQQQQVHQLQQHGLESSQARTSTSSSSSLTTSSQLPPTAAGPSQRIETASHLRPNNHQQALPTQHQSRQISENATQSRAETHHMHASHRISTSESVSQHHPALQDNHMIHHQHQHQDNVHLHIQANLKQFQALQHASVASTSSSARTADISGRPFRRALSVDAALPSFSSSSSNRPVAQSYPPQADVQQYSLVPPNGPKTLSSSSSSSSTFEKKKHKKNQYQDSKNETGEHEATSSTATHDTAVPSSSSAGPHISYAYDDGVEADSPPGDGDMSFGEHQDPADLAARFSSVSQIEAHPTLCPETGQAIYPCPFCDKHYGGKHARSIWRRHLSNKHGIPLNLQPRRTRWDNDVNRPKDSAERHKRTLESKRRWAAKNRAEKRAKRKGTTVEEELGLMEAGSDGKNVEFYYGDDTAGEESFSGLHLQTASTPQEVQHTTSPYIPNLAPPAVIVQSAAVPSPTPSPALASIPAAAPGPAHAPLPLRQHMPPGNGTAQTSGKGTDSAFVPVQDKPAAQARAPLVIKASECPPAIPRTIDLSAPHPLPQYPPPQAGASSTKAQPQLRTKFSPSTEHVLERSQIQFIPYQRQQHVRQAASPIHLALSPAPSVDAPSPSEVSFPSNETVQSISHGFAFSHNHQPVAEMQSAHTYAHPMPIYASYGQIQEYAEKPMQYYAPSSSMLQVQPSDGYMTSISMSASNSTRSLSPMEMPNQYPSPALGFHLTVPHPGSSNDHYVNGLQRSVSEPRSSTLSFKRPDGPSPMPLDLSKITSQRAYSPLEMQNDSASNHSGGMQSQHSAYDSSLNTPDAYAYYSSAYGPGETAYRMIQAEDSGHMQQPPTPYFYLSVPDSTPMPMSATQSSLQQQQQQHQQQEQPEQQAPQQQLLLQQQMSPMPEASPAMSAIEYYHVPDSQQYIQAACKPRETATSLLTVGPAPSAQVVNDTTSDKTDKKAKAAKSGRKRTSSQASKPSKRKKKTEEARQTVAEASAQELAQRPTAPRASSAKTYQEAAMQLLALKTSSSSPPGSPYKRLLGLADTDGEVSIRGSEVDTSMADSGYGAQDSIDATSKGTQRGTDSNRMDDIDINAEIGKDDDFDGTHVRFASVPPSSPTLQMSLSPASSPLPVVLSKLSATYLRSIARSTPAGKQGQGRSHKAAGIDENVRRRHAADIDAADKISLDSSPIREELPRSKRSLLTSSPVSPGQVRVRSRSHSPNRHMAGSSFATSVVMSTPHASGPFFSQHSALMDSAPGPARREASDGEGGNDDEGEQSTQHGKASLHKAGLPSRIFKIDNCSRPSAGLGMASSSSPARPFLLSSPEHAAVSKSLGLVPDNFTHTTLSLPSDPEGFEMHFLRGFGSTSLGMAEYAKDVFGGPLGEKD